MVAWMTNTLSPTCVFRRSLYSILLLLPQGDAFRSLQQRLQCVPPAWLVGGAERPASGVGKPGALDDTAGMLELFVQAQKRRLQERQRD